ncbi:MAG: hypothetical protein C0608_06370 [Deltaproteobacteria bacterium]|nr:MAG: hypothetical protein C0608_06370 [Deltaproteobacteria bacterium]
MSHMESEARLQLLKRGLGSGIVEKESFAHEGFLSWAFAYAFNFVAIFALYILHLPRMKG